MEFIIVVILALLASPIDTTMKIGVTKHKENGVLRSFTIQCNIKKGACYDHCDNTVIEISVVKDDTFAVATLKADNWVTYWPQMEARVKAEGRFFVNDPSKSFFSATIKNVRKEDAARYTCSLLYLNHLDQLMEDVDSLRVTLEDDDEKVAITQLLHKVSSLEEQIKEQQKQNMEQRKRLYRMRKEDRKDDNEKISLTQKVSSLEEQIKKQQTRMMEQQTQMMEQQTQMMEQHKQLYKMQEEDRKDDDAKVALTQKVSSLEEQIKKRQNVQGENRKDDVQNSITNAALGLRTAGLVTRWWVRLDRVVLVSTAGILNETTGCLMPTRKGKYFVGVKMWQDGEGEISVRVRWDESGTGQNMVKTGRDGDLQTGVGVFVMDDGKKYCFEALRTKGEAQIRWCLVYGWYLPPL